MTLATPAQLPALLREPPWLNGVRAAEPPRLALPPLAQEPRAVWSAEARDQARHAPDVRHWWSNPLTPEALARFFDNLGVRPEARERLGAGAAVQAQDFLDTVPPHRPPVYSLLRVPDALALTLWNGVASARWPAESDAVVLSLLAHHSVAAAPGLLAYARQRPVQGLRIGLWLDSAELAALALKALRALKIARQSASAWLLAHPDTAAQVLLRQLFGDDDGAREDARSALHAPPLRALHEALHAAARSLGEDVALALHAQLQADPLLRLPAPLPKLPGFFVPADLHRPVLQGSGAALPDDAMRHLGLMLAISRPDQPYAGLDAVRAACTEASLAQFAWSVFDAWWAAGAPSKDAWAFTALALLHDDNTAHRLGPRALRWAKEGLKARAVAAVEMLAGFGSDAALMHLNHLAERCKATQVRNRAALELDAVAQQRGLARIELADRLVPTLGLDESRVLDFGPRRFTIGLDETLAAHVIDAQGARLKDLPKPRQSDDAARAQAAALRWKQLRQELKALAGVQIARLEQAMVAQRRWSPEEFSAFFVRHPLMRALAARLLWSVHDGEGRPVAACRLAEDDTLADAGDALYAPPASVQFAIAHPLRLSADVLTAFTRQFHDYEILQPFAQLARETFALTPQEAAQSRIERWAGRDAATGALIGLLDRGWQRGPVGDGGMIFEWHRSLGAGVQAVLALDPGLPVGQLFSAPRQTLGRVLLQDAPGQPAAAAGLDPIQCSELLRDLHRLAPLAAPAP